MENYTAIINELITKDKYAEALIYCGKALRENPKNEDVINKAVFIFKRIQDAHLDLEPTNAEEYTLRGIAYFYIGEIDSSIHDYTKAIELDKNYDYAFKSRHIINFIMGNLSTAENDIRRAIEINPIAEYYNDLGNVISSISNSNFESLDCYLKAVQLEPQIESFWYNYGCDLADKGQFENAIEKLDKAIVLNPNYEDALFNRKCFIDHLRKLNK